MVCIICFIYLDYLVCLLGGKRFQTVEMQNKVASSGWPLTEDTNSTASQLCKSIGYKVLRTERWLLWSGQKVCFGNCGLFWGGSLNWSFQCWDARARRCIWYNMTCHEHLSSFMATQWWAFRELLGLRAWSILLRLLYIHQFAGVRISMRKWANKKSLRNIFL